MQIFIKTKTGKHITLETEPTDYILDVKAKILDKEGIPICSQTLYYGVHKLENEYTLEYYSVQKDSSLNMIINLKGGKPVIYLYPEYDNFDIKVKVEMKKEDGKITSRYPIINDDTETWIVKANRNGDIEYNQRKHYYLFWECVFYNGFEIDEGFVVEGSKIYEFFEDKLNYLGFKEREANDFITYWCPQMEHSNFVLIKFQDEDYKNRAHISIEPKPDFIRRIFITFKLLNEKKSLPEQKIDKFKIERRGFYVLEWGGYHIIY